MRKSLAVLGLATLLLLLPHPIAADRQVNVLRPFVTLPTGLLAEGLAITGDHFYVGTVSFTAADGTILVLDKSGATMQTFTIPGLPGVGQVTVHDGALFAVACTAFAPAATGDVVHVNLQSGDVTTVAAGLPCPNGLAIDKQGNMFVTNIFAGTVSKVTPSGAVSIFASGPLLTPMPIPIGFTLGPNDIAFNKQGTALYVTNVGLGTVVKIEVMKDGTAGSITNFAIGIPTPDGVAFDQKGKLYVTSPFTNAIWVVAPDGSASPLALDTTAESLNNPSNVAFQGPELYISNLGLSGFTGKISAVTVQIPGLPV